jgi:elongation factor 1-beta
MANVLALIKVMPKSVDTNLEKLQTAISKKLPPKVTIKKVETEEIAFGLKALKLSLILPDDAGGTDIVEESIRKVSGVSDVQVEFCSRL